MSSTKRVACVLAILCATQMAGAETVEKSSAADLRGEVEISNVAGSVHVTGWDRAEVQVTADLGKNVERLDFKRDGEHTYIKVVLPSGRVRSGDTDLTIRVPRDSRLVINTVSADQTLEDVRGTQRLQTVSGDIRTQVWGGEFRAESVSGDISATGAPSKEQKGRVRVTSVSGSISVENLGDDLEVETVSGDMKVHAPTLSRARAKTTNGDLQLAAALARDARVDAESINGEVSLNIDGTVDAEFDIETFNGQIDNCFGPKAKRTHEYGPGNELRFKEGEGHSAVRIKTLNGKVTLCRTPRMAR